MLYIIEQGQVQFFYLDEIGKSQAVPWSSKPLCVVSTLLEKADKIQAVVS